MWHDTNRKLTDFSAQLNEPICLRAQSCFLSTVSNILSSRLAISLQENQITIMAARSTYLITILILIGVSQAHQEPQWLDQQAFGPCDSCANSLIKLLEDIDQDLEYANKSVNSAIPKLTLKVIELNSTREEHSIGLSESEDLLKRTLRTADQYLNNNFAEENVKKLELKLLDQLERSKRMLLRLSRVGLKLSELMVSAASIPTSLPSFAPFSNLTTLLC